MSQVETPEQREMRSTVRTLLEKATPIEAARRAEGDHTAGFDRDVWNRLVRDLGVSALLVPEQADGLGLSLVDAAIVLEELGRACYNGPALESAILVPLLLTLADHDVTTDLAALASGARIATVGGLDTLTTLRPTSDVSARLVGDDWALEGTAFGVPFGGLADVLYVVARSEDGLGVWAVESDASGHERRPLDTLDLTRPMAAHHFSETPARLVITPASDGVALRRFLAVATTALTAEQVGATRRLLEETVQYVRTRYQFGRAIGSFQAVKHRAVNMSIAAEGATAASWSARLAGDAALTPGGDAEAWDESIRLASVAGSYCSKAFIDVAGATLQLHGGIGMSWEHDIHVYLRRAKSSARLLGSPAHHRATLRRVLNLATA
jgi:alkylation response protein AidB-like acyl-CoA dehydrogenase